MKPVYYPEKVPFADGGYKCDKCDAILSLEEFLGVYFGTVFQVKGYHCKGCGYQSCDVSVKSGNVPFDWERLPVSRLPVRTMAVEGV